MVVPIKYSKSITENHPLAKKYLQSITSLLKNEGAAKNSFTCETAINLETCENDKKRNKPQARMDFAIGLETSKMLLVEAKLNIENPKNLRKSELDDKINNSTNLLNEYEVLVANEKVFLFSQKCINQARNNVKRLLNNSPKIYVYTVKEFKDAIFQ